ncbi:isochorismatase family protein [Longivirga aurantiaca]|uniref:Isochorismatase family protein n=1 Tax=Longivirga aurantiaca TaxID=1837743 RepID=A0ABW1T558_9ACTN
MPHLDVSDCVLVVIDAQPGFYPPSRLDVDRAQFASALDRAAWVAGLASALGAPAVLTEEDAPTNGPTYEAITRVLPPASPVLVKQVFGADANPEIDLAVRRHGRSAVVLVGLETDVCVAHSAIGWSAAGVRVVVVHDAVYSAGAGHVNGIARLRAEGVELLSAKELYYEWLRDLPSVRAFDAAHPDLATPPGFSL